MVIATDPHGHNLGFLDLEPLLFHSSSSSIINLSFLSVLFLFDTTLPSDAAVSK
jgi:hypothetical protein